MVIFIARTAAQILKEKEREKWIHSKIQQQKNESYKKPIKEIKAAQTKKKKEEKKKKKKKYQLQKKKKTEERKAACVGKPIIHTKTTTLDIHIDQGLTRRGSTYSHEFGGRVADMQRHRIGGCAAN